MSTHKCAQWLTGVCWPPWLFLPEPGLLYSSLPPPPLQTRWCPVYKEVYMYWCTTVHLPYCRHPHYRLADVLFRKRYICTDVQSYIFLTAATPSTDTLMPCVQRGTTIAVLFTNTTPSTGTPIFCVQRGIYVLMYNHPTSSSLPPPSVQTHWYLCAKMYRCTKIQLQSSTLLLTAVQTRDALCT